MYTKILIPVDGSELAECVLPPLRWFVKVSHVNEIVFLRVVEPFKVPGGILDTAVPENEREHLETDAVKEAIKYLTDIGNEFEGKKLKVTREVLVGKPAKTIGDYVRSCDVDLIIMATHGYSGFHRWVSGSIADEILHAAHVPILLVRPEDRPPD
jgi:nucleotide-binding universal stress UspA family protein